MLKRLLHRSYYRNAGLSHRLRALTPGGWFVLLAMLAAGAIGIDTKQAMSFQMFALLLAAFLVAGLWYCWPPPRLMLTRELPRYGSVGAKFSYRVRIANPNRHSRLDLTLTEEFGDFRPTHREFLRWAEPGEEHRNAFDRAFGYYRWLWLMNRNRPALAEETALPILPPQSETIVTMELLPQRRGVLRFGPALISARDPLGLARRNTHIGEKQSMLILPKLYFIPERAMHGGREFQAGGATSALSVGGYQEFVSIRDYRQGDPLRHVHWKSSARADRLLVREFQDQFFVRQAIVLDTFDDHASLGVFEEAVSLAASYASGLRTTESLVDILMVQDGGDASRPERGIGTPVDIMETLAAVEPCRNKSVEVLTELVFESLPRFGGVIVILLAWDEPRRELVRLIRESEITLRVILIVEPGQSKLIDPGPMADQPESFACLEAGKLEAGLANLE